VPDSLVAILVGDPEWEPSLVDDREVNPYTGNVAAVQQTPALAMVPRWLWDGERIEELSPVPARIDYYFDL